MLYFIMEIKEGHIYKQTGTTDPKYWWIIYIKKVYTDDTYDVQILKSYSKNYPISIYQGWYINRLYHTIEELKYYRSPLYKLLNGEC